MKALAPLLLASLAVNVVLGILVVRRAPAAPPSHDSGAPLPGSPQAATVALPGGPSAREAAPKAPAPSAKVREPLWAGLKSDSIDDAIARLRAAGCSSREIAVVIRAMIQELTMERRRELGYANETLPYWKSGTMFGSPRPNLEMNNVYAQMQKLERTYLLTPEFFGADDTMLRIYRDRFGPFEIETLRKIALLESERNEKAMQMMAGSTQAGVSAYPRDPRQSEQVQAEYDAALQSLLTPEEYAQYELRNGPAARSLNFRYGAFQPTEAEFKALFAIEKAQMQNREAGQKMTPEQRKSAQAEYEAAIKAALGPERAADFDALQKAGSDRLPALVARLNLPLRTITTINAVRDDTNSRAKAILDNPQLTPDQRSAQLNSLANEAEADLGALFGTTRGLEAYKDIKGEWLRNLRPKTPTP